MAKRPDGSFGGKEGITRNNLVSGGAEAHYRLVSMLVSAYNMPALQICFPARLAAISCKALAKCSMLAVMVFQ